MTSPVQIVLMATSLLAAGQAGAAEPMTLADYMALDGPAPTAQVVYGPAPSQYAEVFRPTGEGPFPVALLIHGGCWQKDLGGIRQFRNLAGALVAEGIAVWNVEYRRIDEDGGGYPGTYQDVAAALDLMLASSTSYGLDTERVVAVGHSAGGQLVQWLAGRARLPVASPLHVANPPAVREVVSLGAVNDLRAFEPRSKAGCGIDMAALTGTPDAARGDVYADTSPAELLPTGSHTVLVNGELDRLMPPATARAFADKARQAGDRVDLLVLPRASHFDEVAPSSPAWPSILAVIRSALSMEPAR